MVGVKRIRAIARREAKDVIEDLTEAKYVDTVLYNVATVSSTALAGYTTLRVTSTSQGTDLFNRLGDEIKSLSLLVRWQASLSSPIIAAGGSSTLRMICFVDKAANGAVPPVFQGAADSPYSNNGPNVSPPNLQMNQRYQILYDKTRTVSMGHNPFTAGKFYLKLRYNVHYLASGSGIADASLNQIYVVFLSADATNGPTVTAYARYRFMDI